MVEFITEVELASYLRDPSLATDASLVQLVEFANELLTEEWTTPVVPIPVKVKLLALNVAARAWVNNPSLSNIESYTRSLDDASRTERYRASSHDGSIFLTESEEALLNGRSRRRSIRLTIYGQV